MRKLKLEMQVSLDGFALDVDGKTDWMLWNWGEDWTWDKALRRRHIDLTTSSDCILLSRMMAEEGFHDHWANVDPADPRSAFAQPIAKMRKVVFSKTLDHSKWPNTDLAKGKLADEVTRLKAEPGKDIIAHGGAQLRRLPAQGRPDRRTPFVRQSGRARRRQVDVHGHRRRAEPDLRRTRRPTNAVSPSCSIPSAAIRSLDHRPADCGAKQNETKDCIHPKECNRLHRCSTLRRAAAANRGQNPKIIRSQSPSSTAARHNSSAYPPLQQRIWRVGIAMMLEHAFHLGADRHRLHGIAEQIANHAHAAGLR